MTSSHHNDARGPSTYLETAELVFSASLTVLPPSTNRAYRSTPRGVLKSAEARRFEAEAKAQLLRSFSFDAEPINENEPHCLELHFFFKDLENKSWPKTAKRRYKRRDTSNYVKLTEDVVAEALGIDDSCFLKQFNHKSQHHIEGVHIKLWRLACPSTTARQLSSDT